MPLQVRGGHAAAEGARRVSFTWFELEAGHVGERHAQYSLIYHPQVRIKKKVQDGCGVDREGSWLNSYATGIMYSISCADAIAYQEVSAGGMPDITRTEVLTAFYKRALAPTFLI